MRAVIALAALLMLGACGGDDGRAAHDRALQRAREELRTQTYQQVHGGADCVLDCSGHEAGYAWAKERQIGDPSLCAARGPSFNRGCRAYAEDLAQRVDALLRAH